MPTISTFYGILIQTLQNDHAPPYFHALYAEKEVLIDIRTLEIMEGQMPRRALSLILEWAKEHRAELMEDWELCTRNQPPQPSPEGAINVPNGQAIQARLFED